MALSLHLRRQPRVAVVRPMGVDAAAPVGCPTVIMVFER
ncbi:hypothetical protein A7982_12246 [Minicystis rosea]|nr:hypothetical protein A7982_12246 [Minicystis rosea]